MTARRWDILMVWGFASFWDMQEMLDTTKGGGNWRVGDARIVRSWPFVSGGGVSLTWLCWAGSAAGWPLSLTHGSRQAPHVPFQCSSVLLDWVSSWFCRARVCQSLPLHSRVVTLSPSCCAPLSSPFYPAWTGQSISGHLVGSRPRTPVLTLPSLALRALQTATCLLPVTPLRPHGRTCSSLTCLLAHVLTPSA